MTLKNDKLIVEGLCYLKTTLNQMREKSKLRIDLQSKIPILLELENDFSVICISDL